VTIPGTRGETAAVEATFVFVDLDGYTAASWVHGDDTAADLAITLLEMAIASCQGGDEVVKSIGDAVMCKSTDPASALALVRRLWARADAEPHFPQLRGALNHGSATMYRDDYFGTTVNIAARLAALAEADEILATGPVADAATTVSWSVEPGGERHLRNIGEPIDVFRLAPHDRVPNPIDPICHMRVDPADAVSLMSDGDVVYFCSAGCRDVFETRRLG
jgi:adenylate cyclase